MPIQYRVIKYDSQQPEWLEDQLKSSLQQGIHSVPGTAIHVMDVAYADLPKELHEKLDKLPPARTLTKR